MSDDPTPELVGRRNLLGRSAALAGTAAAGAIALGVAGSRTAAAESRDPLVLGSTANRAHTPTRLEYAQGEYPSLPTLALANRLGPALQLEPVPDDTDFQTEPGAFFALGERPVYRASDGTSSFAVGLATLDDVDLVQQPFVTAPQRILDTTKSYPGNVEQTDSFDASGRLKAGRFVDLAVGTIDRFTIRAAFLNVHSTGATASGVLSVYPPGQPKQATLHFTRGVTVANFTITPAVLRSTTDSGPTFFVRVYASATTHVQVDLLGQVRDGVVSDPNTGVPAPLQHKTKRNRLSARRVASRLKPPR